MPDEFPPNPRSLRRGDVVHERDHGGWIVYGRVWRRFDADHVVVIDCHKHVTLYRDDELVLTDYDGYDRIVRHGRHPIGPDGQTDWLAQPAPDTYRFQRMTSLRQLKAMARDYHPHFGGHGWSKAKRRDAIANPQRFVPPAQRRVDARMDAQAA